MNYKYLPKILDAKNVYSFIRIVYWEDVLLSLLDYKKCHDNKILNDSIELIEFILKSEEIVEFESEEVMFMQNIQKLRKEATSMWKTTEVIWQTIEQLKDSFGWKSSKGKMRQEISESALGYYFYYNESCYLGYTFYNIDDEVAKGFTFSLAVHKDSVKQTAIASLNKESYYYDGEWYYFKLPENIVFAKNAVQKMFELCKEYLKKAVNV
jgi:hypothetical protein